MESLETRMVIPLVPASALQNRHITWLTPKARICDRDYFIVTSQMAGVGKKALGSFVVDLAGRRQEIIAAIDFLVSGF